MFTAISTNFNGATSQSGPMLIPYPGTPVEGDLLFCFIGVDFTGNITLPAGWTQLHNQRNSNRGVILWRRADGTESGNLSVTMNSSQPCTAVMTLVHSDTTALPLFIGAYRYSSSADCPNLPIPFAVDDALFISGMAGANRGLSTTGAMTYPDDYDDAQAFATTNTTSTSASYTGCGVATKTGPSDGDENPGRFIKSSPFNAQVATIMVYETKPAPIVYGVTPTGTGLDTPLGITITGENFRAGLTVEIDGVACTDIVLVSDTEITATVPASAEQKSATIVVENDDAQSDSIDFFYMALSPVQPAESTVTANFEVSAVRYIQ